VAFKTILKPEGSVVAGIATGIMVWAVYDRSLPDAATMHATKAHDINIEAGRKKAVYTSAALLGVVTLITRDHNVFILGGAVLIALDWHTRHANVTNPDTGKLDGGLTSGFTGQQTQGYAQQSGPGRLSVVS
jgi:hypothetical protein